MSLIAFALSIGDEAHQKQFQANRRLAVLYEVSGARARLERELNARLFLASGLTTYISLYPDTSAEALGDFAAEVMAAKSGFHSVQLVPRGAPELLYTLEANGNFAGTGLIERLGLAETATRAVKQDRMVLAGPAALPGGERVLVALTPVYARPSGAPSREREFWGMVNVLVNLDALLGDAGVQEYSDGTVYALRGRDGRGAMGEVFFGDPEVFSQNPVSNIINFSNGSWQIAAAPVEGWDAIAPGAWEIRVTATFIVLLTGMLIWFLIRNRFILHQEIEDRTQMERALRESERMLYTLMQNMPGMAYQCRPDDHWTMDFVSRGAAELTGYEPGDLIDNNVVSYEEIVHPDDREERRAVASEALRNRRPFKAEYRIVTAGGERRWVWEQGVGVYDEGGQLVVIEGFVTDITPRKLLEDELRRLSLQDGLTRIPNRRFFDERVRLEWNRSERTREPLSVIMCDIDFFKPYNDTYGHQAGDECLIAIAQEIKNNLKRPADFVARYGGEEFVVVLPETAETGARYVAERLRKKISVLNVPNSASPVSHGVTISVGVSTCRPKAGASVEKLIEAADHALYEAKRKGRDRVEFSGASGDAFVADCAEAEAVGDRVRHGEQP